MKTFIKSLVVASLLVASVASAAETYLGTITSTGTAKNNTTTSTAFTIPFAKPISIQCDADAYFLWGADNTISVSSSTGVKVLADVLTDSFSGRGFYHFVAVISVSGTVNCKVFEVVY